jgi:hypothetical protein
LLSFLNTCEEKEDDDNNDNQYSTVVLYNNNSTNSFSVVKDKGVEYDFDYTTCLNFTALENGCEIGFSKNNDKSLNVEYSTSPNDFKTWKKITIGQSIQFDETETIYFRGTNSKIEQIEIYYKGNIKKDGDFNLLF